MPQKLENKGYFKFDSLPSERRLNGKIRRLEKSTDFNRYELFRGQSSMRSESQETDYREKKKYRLPIHQCPSCHCYLDVKDSNISKKRSTEKMEALLDNYQSYLVGSKYSRMSRSKSPFSLPNEWHWRSRGNICSLKRDSSSKYKHSSKKTAGSERLHLKLIDNTDSSRTGIRCRTADDRKRSILNPQLDSEREESGPNTDCSENSSTGHCQLEKDKVLCSGGRQGSIAGYGREQNEELKQTKQDSERLNELTLEVEDHGRIEKLNETYPEKMEQKQIYSLGCGSRDDEDEPGCVDGFPILPSYDDLNVNAARTDKETHRVSNIEASPSHQKLSYRGNPCREGVRIDSSERLPSPLSSERKLSSKISEHPLIRSVETRKSERKQFSALNAPTESRNQKEEDNEKKENVHVGDLDLQACKNYVVDLIDRALSKQLGTEPGENENHVIKESSTLQEMCIKVIRALRYDHCQSYPHNLPNFQDNMDKTELFRSFRRAYVRHIQEELRSLEEIIDICSPKPSRRRSRTS